MKTLTEYLKFIRRPVHIRAMRAHDFLHLLRRLRRVIGTKRRGGQAIGMTADHDSCSTRLRLQRVPTPDSSEVPASPGSDSNAKSQLRAGTTCSHEFFSSGILVV
jgi:hypothetical protein